MDSNITGPQFLNNRQPLSEPHFDEEATLLSARPVVPLQEVNALRRPNRQLLFGVAIVAALLLGALAGALIYKRGVLAPLTEAVQQDALPAEQAPAEQIPVAEGGKTPDDAPAPSVQEEGEAPLEDSDSGPETPERAENVRKTPSDESAEPAPVRQQARIPDEAKRESQTRRSEETDGEVGSEPAEYDSDIRRSERREGRLKRGKRGHPSDDLSRIREIFEGSPRPPD